ncbi:MAG: DNA methyltransferase, partial [Maribacter sp.]
ELLHIIGLEEVKDKGKKIIYRKSKENRDYASFLENTIFTLEDRDYLVNIRGFEGDNEKSFNVGLELCLTWINRILFLKLLESQLLAHHKGAKEYKFLNSDFIGGFDVLNNLFFSALAKKPEERHQRYRDKFKNIPYLNSSLFERNELENATFAISAINDDEIEVYSSTILKDSNGNRLKGKLGILDYLFKFLDSYDFATDGNEGIQEGSEHKTLINASVLGLIFEKINGYKEGSFYTPASITMYMTKETLRRSVVKKFKEAENNQIENFDDLKAYCRKYFKIEDIARFNAIINSMRICDPAVGSGHFLVSALNELIAIKNELGIITDNKGLSLRCDIHVANDELFIIDENGSLFEYNPNNIESSRIQRTLFNEKQTLIENCLFGVDINPNSVKICRLRLWIELLKNAYYTENKELQTLPNIDINIKNGNSLISRFQLTDNLRSAFKGKKIKYNFTDYKNAVSKYKNTNSKEEKREVLEIINEVKSDFKSSLDRAFVKKFQAAQG